MDIIRYILSAFRELLPSVPSWLVRALLVLGVSLIGAEQAFLHFYLDPLSERDDRAIFAYIKSIDPQKLEEAYRPWPCKKVEVAIIYDYQICIFYDLARTDDDPPVYRISVIRPAGYITLIPWNYPDRAIFDGADIFTVDSNLRILSDKRRGRNAD